MINRLREARMMRGVTLYELSKMTGFSTKLLSSFEDGLIKPGDYIIRGVKGELYGCDAEIFKETYEKVEG